MQILGNLFGSNARVKLLRLFLFNPYTIFEPFDIRRRAKLGENTVRSEVATLKNIGLIKRKSYLKTVVDGRTGKTKKKRTYGWTLDHSFPYFTELQDFVVKTLPYTDRDILARVRPTGRLKLVVASGIFIQDWESRLDMLLVGDHINERQLAAAMKSLEAEIGKELKYATFSTSDFEYRMAVRDRLLRDIFDYSHRLVLDKIELSEDQPES